MTTLSDFFSLEGSSYTKELLLKTIDAAISNKMEMEELTFNVYSVTIFPQENKVIIYNDIDPEDNPGVEFPLMDFYNAVKNFNGQ